MAERINYTIHSDVAESSGAIVLHIGVGRVKQADEHRNGTCVDQLLPVFIYAYIHEIMISRV